MASSSGKHRIFIKTYGCTHNQADSEQMAGLLEAAGYEIVDEENDADLLLVNSCAVKDPAEKKFLHDIRTAKLPVVIAGCVVQGNQGDEFLQQFSAVGVKDIDNVVEVVAETLKGKKKRTITRRKNPSLTLPRSKSNPFITIIPVNSGCLSGCTYCKTVHARGRLESHPVAEIVKAIEAAVDVGAKEIWLTSEDVGAYGQDIGENMASLLNAVAKIRGQFMVRVGMANPQHVIKELEKMLKLLKNNPKRFFHFLHVPVQSGSDLVLEHMERGYKVKDFLDIVSMARKEIPGFTIMNDYIVGYPTETEEDFEKTMALAADTACRILNINKFYPRPGTRAAKLKLLPTKIVARRCKELVELYESQDPNAGMIGTTVEALFTQHGKPGSVVGHTQNYTQVVLKTDDDSILGTWQTVKIIDENKFYLTVEIAKV